MSGLLSFAPAFGAVLAAGIAAMTAFVAAVLTKENKTSEFRQAWIEAIRNDVAELLGEFNTLEMALQTEIANSIDPVGRQRKADLFVAARQKDYAKMDLLCNRIVLRLHPVEHEDVINKIRNIEDAVGRGPLRSLELSRELTSEVSTVLKAEWKRVKQGEPEFTRLKKIVGWSLIFVAVSVSALSVVAIAGSK